MIKVDRVYEIRLPAEVRGLLQHLTFTISLGLEGVPLTCLGAKGYVRRLLLWVLVPWIAVLVLVIAMAAKLQIVRRVWTTKRQPLVGSRSAMTRSVRRFSQSEARSTKPYVFVEAIRSATPMVLRIFFLAYPIVTNVAFEAFSCFEFEGDSSWLIADVSIECGTDEHLQAKSLAWVAIALYPIGLIFMSAMLLLRERHAIEFGPRTELSKALAFLHSEYKPHFLYATQSSPLGDPSWLMLPHRTDAH